MPTNNFLQFATAAGALVEADADYASDAARLLGFQNGVADPAHVNKVWRQGSAAAAMLGQIIVDHGLADANDSGDTAGQKAALRAALAAMLASSAFGQDTSATPNAIVAALDPAPPNLITPRNLFVRINNTNTGPVTIALNGLGTKNATRHDGTPLQSGDIIVGQFSHFVYDGTLGFWVLAGYAAGEIPRVATAATLYVRPSGNDANDGSANTDARAFATPEAATIFAGKRFAAGSGVVTIQMASGLYPAPSGGLQAPSVSILWNGNPSSPGTVIIQGTGQQIGGGSSVIGVSAGRMSFNGITIQNTGGSAYNNHTLGAVTGAAVNVTNVLFVAQTAGSAGAHILSGTASNVVINAGCSMAGSIAYGLNSIPGGNIVIGGVVTMNSAPNFTQTFANALSGVIQCALGAGFSGSATGTRYYSAANGVINTNGGGVNFFPGNVAGSTALGGQYL